MAKSKPVQKSVEDLSYEEALAELEQVVSALEDAKARGAAILGIFHDEAARTRVCDRLVDVTGFTPRLAA